MAIKGTKSKRAKFVPYMKLSKRSKRELDSEKRIVWEGLSPVTRIVKDKKKYDRKREKQAHDSLE